MILLIMTGFYIINLNRRGEEDTKLREIVEEIKDQDQDQEQGETREADTGEGKMSDSAQKYPNLFGTLEIPETRINYPVAYIPNNSSYYLTHNLRGEESVSGNPFLAGECFSGCENLIIYGHHMSDGSIFAELLKYKDYGFYKEHPKVLLSTNDNSSGEYQIVGAFYSRVGDPDFDYYNYYDLRDPARKSEFVQKLKRQRLYETETPVDAGGEFLTLSTCSYHVKDGRFVVVALKN